METYKIILLPKDTCHKINEIVRRYINKVSGLDQCNQELLQELKETQNNFGIDIWSKSQQKYLPCQDVIAVDLNHGLIEIKVWSGNACHYKITDLVPRS